MRAELRRLALVFGLCGGLGGMGCEGVEPEYTKPDESPAPGAGMDGKEDSSVEASFLVFEFDGELEYSWGSAQSVIEDSQMLYTIGHLNGNRSVGRLDNLELSNIKSTSLPDGRRRATYHAVLPVAWGSKTNLPSSYEFKLPRNMDDLEGFTSRYKTTCVDRSAHDVDSGSMWYYYRPFKSGCAIDDAELVKITASVRPSTNVTTGKYPEYHKVWEDGELRVVSIFGKYEKTGTTAADAGIAAYNQFVGMVKSMSNDSTITTTTTPAVVPSSPGVGAPDIEFRMTLASGRKVLINALLVDEISSAPQSFRTRYDQLSTRADLIAYNGHAGLGQNIRALATWGSWTAGQYLILFSNGCDTYAYVDGSLAQERSRVNPDDPGGSKYLDFVVNAMPAFFASDAAASMALIRGLMKVEAPQTYEAMFRNIDRSQVVLVTGEEDNVYVPGGGGGGGTAWAGLTDKASVAKGGEKKYSSGEVGPGSYLVTLSQDPAAPAGDADLYVRVGAEPTTSAYDCRPYKDGSDEECRVTLATRSTIYISVRGYSAASFLLVAKQEGSGGGAAPWAGLDESGTVAKSEEKRWEAAALAPGRYSFVLTGSGDADLYVKLDSAPTTSSYACRPYKNGSNEECTVTLNEERSVHVMVRGYAASSTFRLVGKKL